MKKTDKQIDFNSASWLNKPAAFEIQPDHVKITTDPDTDFWQRTYYGFRHDNAHALLLNYHHNFTFTCHVAFDYRTRFDQCGVAVYTDSNTWFKASVEHETATQSRLGSVVTNNGYSDWASTDISGACECWYRLSRRGADFLIEHSADGVSFQQMRIFHLQGLGVTLPGQTDPPAPAALPVRFGLYACSPGNTSFSCVFDQFILEDCQWLAHH